MPEKPQTPEEALRGEKEQEWTRLAEQVETITDRLGERIDERIKEPVTSLLANEFPTTASCEGHLGERALNYPWIQIDTPAPKGWRESEEKKEEWTRENLKQQQRMLVELGEFYQDRETTYDARLTIASHGGLGAFRIQSIGSEVMTLLSPEAQEEKQKNYRRELDDFGAFLKKKFFSK